MQHIPGWLKGAMSTGALFGAFYAGGQAAVRATPAPDPIGAAQMAAPGPEADGAGEASAQTAPLSRPVTRVTAAPRVVTRPAVIDDEPLEVYQPRVVRTSYPPRASASTRVPDAAPVPDAPPTRSWKRSAVIIGSTAAVAATVGGLAKGKKGALIGGIVGGGAATVWDQMTRRRADARDR